MTIHSLVATPTCSAPTRKTKSRFAVMRRPRRGNVITAIVSSQRGRRVIKTRRRVRTHEMSCPSAWKFDFEN